MLDRRKTRYLTFAKNLPGRALQWAKGKNIRQVIQTEFRLKFWQEPGIIRQQMKTNAVKLRAFGKSIVNRMWKKVVIILMAGIFAIGLLGYSKRHTIIIWHLQANKETQEMVINEMLETAKPIISQELKMSFPEKFFSQVTWNRNEKSRQRDALADIRAFIELGFKNHWLRFKDVHNLSTVNNFDLNGFEFALDWNRENTEEVLFAFNISFLKRKVDKMRVNDDCSFFKELKVYVETKAKKN